MDDRSSFSVESNTFLDNLSGINLPEKILFVIDTVKERNSTPFKFTTGAKHTSLFMMKRVVEHFVCLKSTIQRNHEYAIMTLNSQGAQWICDFTGNVKSIVNHLDVIDEEIPTDDLNTYDLENWYFFIDVLYIHEPPSSENVCEEIYAQMAKLDTANYSYILEVGKNAAKLHDNMAKLLAHPLQRPLQKNACYTLYPPSNMQDTYTNVS
ncbi:BRISC and BRCA1-A complex member 1 [Augochlora pura]